MTNQKPIEPLPPRELAQQWSDEWWDQRNESPIGELLFVATKAAQWGFNQRGAVNEAELQKARDEELEAVKHWLINGPYKASIVTGLTLVADLCAARRPKPKSQAEEALVEIEEVEGAMYSAGLGCDFTATRAALERLRELEGNQ